MRMSDWSSDVCSSDLRPMPMHAAFLEEAERIGIGLAAAVGDQHAVLPPDDIALVRAVAFEQPVHDAGAARIGQELAVIADQAARGRREGDRKSTRLNSSH